MQKYKSKTKRWIGIGRDVSDDKWYVNEFAYLDFVYEYTLKMEDLLKKYPFKENKKPSKYPRI